MDSQTVEASDGQTSAPENLPSDRSLIAELVKNGNVSADWAKHHVRNDLRRTLRSISEPTPATAKDGCQETHEATDCQSDSAADEAAVANSTASQPELADTVNRLDTSSEHPGRTDPVTSSRDTALDAAGDPRNLRQDLISRARHAGLASGAVEILDPNDFVEATGHDEIKNETTVEPRVGAITAGYPDTTAASTPSLGLHSGHSEEHADRITNYESWLHSYQSVRPVLVRLFRQSGLRPKIRHVGSTSVAGLKAKPIVDIAVGLSSQAEMIKATRLLAEGALEHIPFSHHERRVIFGVRDDGGAVRFHIQVLHVGDDAWIRTISLIEMLRASPTLKAKYQAAKEAAVVGSGGSRSEYSRLKQATMRDIFRRSRERSRLQRHRRALRGPHPRGTLSGNAFP